MDADQPEQIVWQGKYIVAKTRGRWEYVSRARGIRAAVILAVEDGHVLLVEQYRVPLGVLIYLSMREHRAEIVADRPIAEKVAAEVWGAAMADMLVEIKQGRVAEGMAAGVRDVAAVLAEHFPRAEDDQNELPDRLIEV